MKQFVRERLEDYLSGTLAAKQEAAMEAYLLDHPEERAELALYGESSALFDNLRTPQAVEPAGDFYAHVMQRVEEQRAVPFWMFFLQPAFARRLAFGGLMWLTLLGGYVATFDSITLIYFSCTQILGPMATFTPGKPTRCGRPHRGVPMKK